jgi:hypothetical protein
MQIVSITNAGVCEHCHKNPATFEFACAPHLRGARKWQLCDDCLQHFTPAGTPSPDEMRKMTTSPGEVVCGWTSFPQKAEQHKDEPGP